MEYGERAHGLFTATEIFEPTLDAGSMFASETEQPVDAGSQPIGQNLSFSVGLILTRTHQSLEREALCRSVFPIAGNALSPIQVLDEDGCNQPLGAAYLVLQVATPETLSRTSQAARKMR